MGTTSMEAMAAIEADGVTPESGALLDEYLARLPEGVASDLDPATASRLLALLRARADGGDAGPTEEAT